MGNGLCGCHNENRKKPNKPCNNHYYTENSKSSIQLEPSTEEFAVSPTPYSNVAEIEQEEQIIKPQCFNLEEQAVTPQYRKPSINNHKQRASTLMTPSDYQYRRYTTEYVNLTPENSPIPENPVVIYLYETLLKQFLTQYFPINSIIIEEMVKRKLMSPEHAQLINDTSSNDIEKSIKFIESFIFSEENLCKLADFLFAIVEENGDLLLSFNKSKYYFLSLIDLLYYIINCLRLFHETNISTTITDEQHRQFLSAFHLLTQINSDDNIFLISIRLNNFIITQKFWSGFCLINQQFKICQELNLSHCNLQIDDIKNIIDGFICSPILEKLDLSANPIENEGLSEICRLFNLPNKIQYLNIACCSITSAGMSHFLSRLCTNKESIFCNLKELNISYNDLTDLNEDYIVLLTQLPLNLLSIQSTGMKRQFKLFESLKSNYTLRSVDLSRNRMSMKDFQFLASGIAYNFHIKNLILSNIGLTKNECDTLNKALLMNKSIVLLDLSDNHIGDEGATIFCDLLAMKKTLKELIMKRCNITPNGILNILRIASESRCHLRLIDLCFNYSARLSVCADLMIVKLKIKELLSDISRLKKMKIILYGTLDDSNISQISLRNEY